MVISLLGLHPFSHYKIFFLFSFLRVSSPPEKTQSFSSFSSRSPRLLFRRESIIFVERDNEKMNKKGTSSDRVSSSRIVPRRIALKTRAQSIFDVRSIPAFTFHLHPLETRQTSTNESGGRPAPLISSGHGTRVT